MAGNPTDQIQPGLDLVKKILDASLLGREAAEQVRCAYDQLLERMRASYLSLSIIGAFSAGKSTLINRMIGFPLLKTDVLANTGVPTCLSCGEDGGRMELEVRTREGAAFTLYSTADQTGVLEREGVGPLLDDLEEICGTAQNWEALAHIQDMMALLTADPRVTRRIAELEVRVPGFALGRAVRIMDTPGIDAAGTEGDLHRAVTQEVLRTRTDALALVLDAGQVYTITLEQFLRDNAARFMRHSIVIINKADLIPEDEVQEVEDYVRSLLKDRFGADVPVCLVSALHAGQPGLWQDRFTEMMSLLLSTLESSHETLMNEMALRCIRDVMELAEAGVRERRAEIDAEAQLLEENRPERFSEIEDQLSRDLDERARRWCRASAARCWDAAGTACRNQVSADLLAMDNRSQIRSYVNGDGLKTRISAAFDGVAPAMDAERKSLDDAYARCFAAAVTRLQAGRQALGETLSVQGTYLSSAWTGEDTVRSLSAQVSQTSSKSIRGGGSDLGIAGAALFLLGPLGWAAGSAVSYARNRFKLSEARAAVMEGLRQSILEKRPSGIRELEEQAGIYARALKTQVSCKFRTYMADYAEFYAAAEQTYEVRRQRYAREADTLETFLTEMKKWCEEASV